MPKRIIQNRRPDGNYSRQNDYKTIITDIITHVHCRNIEKKEKTTGDTKDFFLFFYTKTRRKINKKSV